MARSTGNIPVLRDPRWRPGSISTGCAERSSRFREPIVLTTNSRGLYRGHSRRNSSVEARIRSFHKILLFLFVRKLPKEFPPEAFLPLSQSECPLVKNH
jgi:hypothetical protein